MAEAPAEKSLEILSQELTCSLCRSHYDSPKALPCCHYFCQSCVSRLVKTPASRMQVTCPECSNTTALPPGGVGYLPDVYFVNRLKELHARMAMIQRKETAFCESCSNETAEFFCHQCADFMCKDCAKSHGRMTKKYPGHSVAALDQLQENGARTIPMKPALPSKCACAGHEDLCNMFCRDCRQLACSDCILTEHSGHRYELVKKCAALYRRSLQQSLFPLRIISQKFFESLKQIENAKREVSSQGMHVTHSIRSHFDEIISLLEKEKQSLLTQSAKLVQQKLESLNAQEKEVKTTSGIVQNVIEFCKQNVELVSDEEMLLVHKELQNRVQEECSKHQNCAEQLPCEVSNIAVRTSGVEELVQVYRETAEVFLFPTANSSCQVHTAEVGKETTHRIMDSSDPLHTPLLSSLDATLVSVVDGSATQATVTQVGKGLYEVCYTPRIRGRHQLWVKRSGRQIPGCPFHVFATISPSLLGTPLHVMDGLKHPYAAVFGAKNQLYVSQTGGHSIQMFWRNGDSVVSDRFTSQQPKCPTGMALDDEGNIYVVNMSTHTLSKFSQDGRLMGEVGREGSEREDLNHPSGVAMLGGRVYVCDRNNGRIQVYSKELELLSTFGNQGCQDGEMNWPYDIAGDDSNCVYVADSDNHRVQIFDRSGKFLRTFGSRGSEQGSLRRPTGVCVGQDKLLYITEYANHRVSVFRMDGTYVGAFGSYGSQMGQLCYPVGVTVDRDGFVYVCDQGNNRIQVF